MSCSEGEGEAGGEGGGGAGGGSPASPVVKYVLPAVFGGLTLLLAKRWAATPGSPNACHPHSLTGVSRRRRILKDPPVRRAPPPSLSHSAPSAGPSTAPSAAPSTSSGPSASVPPHLSRSATKKTDSQRKPNSNPHASADDGPSLNVTREMAGILSGPRHIPFPNIPQDGNLLFELMTFIFIAMATATQFLNIYRTVWWLPNSYNNQTMNFYLIDRHLVVFILVVIARRLIFCLCNLAVEIICPSKYVQFIHRISRVFVLIMILSILGWCTYNLFQVNVLLNIFYLCYPVIIYLLLFGVDATPFLQLVTWGFRSPHCCASGAPGIRNEVELLKADFNSRLKQIIFSSVVGAYYSSYIPWCFAQSFVYFDIVRIVRHLFLVWVGLVTQHATQCLSARYCDQLHRAALHLGKWDSCDMSPGSILSNLSSGSSSNQSNNAPTGPIVSWCHKAVWASGSIVKHGKFIYTVGSYSSAAAEPGNDMHWRFYILFHNPSAMVCVILCIQVSLVLFELFLLFTTSEWYTVISIAFLLFSNYYTLFKLIRDYLIAWKVYQAEYAIQFKANITPKRIFLRPI